MNIKYDKNMFEYKKGLSWKSRMIVLLMITAIVLLVAVSVDIYRKQKVKLIDPNQSDYYAVFLTNDQVYFGKMVLNNDDQIVLSNVYYVSVNNGDTNQAGQFQLVKLGNEIHGPTDKMFITKNNVLFYEQLRRDSTVVQTIEELETI